PPLCVDAPTPRHSFHSFPTRRSSDLRWRRPSTPAGPIAVTASCASRATPRTSPRPTPGPTAWAASASSGLERGTTVPPSPGRRRSEEHTSELQSLRHLVCRLLLENNK